MKRTLWKRLLPVLLFLICQGFTWQAVSTFRDCYPAVSLRWREPLGEADMQQIENALEAGGMDLSVTAWREEEGTAETDFSRTDAIAVRYDGAVPSIQRFTILEGAEPGALETGAGLISEGLAWALWGSTDVVGQSFTWEGELFTVAAVFQEKAALVYLAETSGAEFTNLELSGAAAEQDPVAAAADLAAQTGLEWWDGAVYGPAASTLLGLLSWLPLALCGFWMLFRLIRLYPIQNMWVRRGVGWGLVLLLAVLLPSAIGKLPGWLTPPRWSDFAFWLRLWEAAKERLEEWFQLEPWTKDVAAKGWLLRWAIGWAGSLLSISWAYFQCTVQNILEAQSKL